MATAIELEDFTHRHNFLGAGHDDNARRTLWVVALTSIMMVGEIIAGQITGSMALLADGFHMATHAGALSVAAIAYAYARRHANNPRFSFGTGKVGDLSGFASALVLGLISLGIGLEAVVRLFEPRPVAFTQATLIAAVGLGVNIISALLLSGSHHHGHGHHNHHVHDHDDHHHDRQDYTPSNAHTSKDNNLRAAYVHVLADALTSVLAILALLGGRFLGWIWLDPLMGLAGAIVIARWSWSLMRETAAVLLDVADDHVAEEVRELLEKPGDVKVADLHVWRLGPDAHGGIVSVVADGNVDYEVVKRRLESVHELAHLTIEVRSRERSLPAL